MSTNAPHDLSGHLSDLSLGSSNAQRAGDLAALLAEDAKYRILTEHIPAITYIAAMDAFSSTLYTSPQIKTILGFSQAQWMADHTLWFKQIHPDDRAFVLKELARIRAGGVPQSSEYRMLTRSGHVRWFMDEASILCDADGNPLALYGVMLDITRQKLLEAALAEAQHQLEESRKPRLIERELVVLRLIHARHTDGEIARELAISERTVRNCVQGICAKLGVSKRAEAVRRAIQWKLIDE